MEEKFVCPRCGNSDPRYVGRKNGTSYCRRCIAFSGKSVEDQGAHAHRAPVELHYSLSREQAAISRTLVENFKKGVNTLVYAVTGAGKTEISYGVLSYAVEHGYHCAFAVPRRDVVIELFWRLKEAFPTNKVVAVYGEHSFGLEGDIVILTTHQLYRYNQYFGLIVMDEIDAFPFKGNAVLKAMFDRAVSGHYVLMTATPSAAVLKAFKAPNHDILELRTRFHKKPIPVPLLRRMPGWVQVLTIIRRLRQYAKAGKPCFVFTPTIALSKDLFTVISLFVKNGDYVNSLRQDRGGIIDRFRKGQLRYLVTTSVLERGVTVKNLQVIVYHADQTKIYDQATLIQIAGRAGRKMDAPTGDVLFLGRTISKAMEGAVREIVLCNSFL